MSRSKWIGGFLGLLSGGPIGALAGFVLGSLFDALLGDDGAIAADDAGARQAYSNATDSGTRNGFLFSLLTLASYVIRADGRIMHSEMEAMRNWVRHTFGENAVDEANAIVLRLFERQRQMEEQQPGSYAATIADVCRQLGSILPQEQRLQLLSMLVMLCKADGHVAPDEVQAMQFIAHHLGLSETELHSMLGLGSTSLADAYAVLEVAPTATDDEVRAAYKRLVVKHHPDRVATLGDDIRAAAEQKMQQINEAKDIVFRSRGM